MNVTRSRVGDARPGGRTARTRAAVLDATLELLAEAGYGELSIERVADRAGVHKTTVYRRWPTKVDLVAAATRERSRVHVPVPDSGNLAGDLRALARSVAATLRSSRVMTANLVAATATSADLAVETRAFWVERLELTRVIVDRAIARGEVADSCDPHVIIETLVGPLYLRLLLTGEPIGDRVADEIADLVAAGATASAQRVTRRR
jgi:AcrR family transcriptional regulator